MGLKPTGMDDLEVRIQALETGGGGGGLSQAQADLLYSAIAHTHSFASLTAKPTTLAGYGIVDAAPLAHVHAAADITSGVLAAARIATGAPDGTKFLRDDQVWTAASGADATKLPLDGTGVMVGPITSTLGVIVTSKPALTATQTWNDAAVAFKGILLNVTNTASDGAARLLDLLVGGVSKFSVDSTGLIRAAGLHADGNIKSGGSYMYMDQLIAAMRQTGFYMGSDGLVVWSNTAGDFTTAADTGLSRNAAGVVEVNNGTPGQYRDLRVRQFGANGSAPQAAVASGGALAVYGTGAFGLDSDAAMSALHAQVVAIRAALVANGIMS